MRQTTKYSANQGFALPTVMIASVVMLIVLLSGLVAASSASVALRSQYYNKISKEAAEAGAALAEACLKKNNYVAQWTAIKPLKQNTDCSGNNTTTCTAAKNVACGIVETDNLRTGFEVGALSTTGTQRTMTIKGYASVLRTSNRAEVSKYFSEVKQSIAFKNHTPSSRPAKRFWLFGTNAGLDFGTSGTTATPVNKCAAAQTCNGDEGHTVISTRNGTLQFWTNGQTIWNRNGLVMQNSTGLNANQSTTQAAAVFPLGSDETKYIVVTNNTVSSYTASENKGELFYSIVDMSLDGGLGGIPAAAGNKNVALAGAALDYASEGLTAAPKSDGSGYWVITYTPDSTRVAVFSFDNLGNVTGPTYYNAPFTPGKYSALSGFGSINFNADYSRLIMMAGNHCVSGTCSSAAGLLRFMSFDTTTGVVGNLLHWDHYAAYGGQGYSADFSPSGNYVFSTTLYPGTLFRYTLGGANTGADVASSVVLGYQTNVTTSGNPGNGGGQVVRAPDGRMYVANWGANAVSVINNPDAPLASNIGWVYNGVSLGTGTSKYGLPQSVTIFTPLSLRY